LSNDNQQITKTEVPYRDVATAPYVYFDRVAAQGILDGMFSFELAARTLTAKPDSGVEVQLATSGRLRCSPVAAMMLRDSLNAALKMHEDAEQKNRATASMVN
jgi:hypothetical protein